MENPPPFSIETIIGKAALSLSQLEASRFRHNVNVELKAEKDARLIGTQHSQDGKSLDHNELDFPGARKTGGAGHNALRKEIERMGILGPAYANSTKTNILGMQRKWKNFLVPTFNLQLPNSNGKPVLGFDGLLMLLQVRLSGIYLLGYTGGCPAEFVDNEKKPPKDAGFDEVFAPSALTRLRRDNKDPDREAQTENLWLLADMLSQAMARQKCLKALCYEDILLAVFRHPETSSDVWVMAVKLVHHKGEHRRLKLYVSAFVS
ncbi:hypothetical protein V8B97DRAFT_2010800 [Scleroderma yunnanense]